MQGIWISSDICLYTHKSFHCPPHASMCGAGSSRSSGAGVGMGGCKALTSVRTDEVCVNSSFPFVFQICKFGKKKKSLFNCFLLKLHLFIIFFPARQCEWGPLADSSVTSKVLCLGLWDSRSLWWASWIISSVLESLIFFFSSFEFKGWNRGPSTLLSVGIPDSATFLSF